MNKRQITLVALALTLGTTPSLVLAEDYYVAGQVDYTDIEIADTSFNPLLSKVKFGVMASESSFLGGTGIEVVLGQQVSNDTVNTLDLDIGSHWGIYTTFATEVRGKLKFALNVGYASTELETASSLPVSAYSETLEGMSFGFTFKQNVTQDSNYSWSFDCNRIYSDDNVTAASCGLGVNYDF